MSRENGVAVLNQGDDESDNDFSNRKARHDSARREKQRAEADRKLAERISSDEVPPHIAALRRVFKK